MKFSHDEQKILLQTARDTIEYGLKYQQLKKIDILSYPPSLQEKGACFVTLKIGDQLRGCIGSLQAYQPLIEDVAHNAYAAAFQDPRFYPVTAAELPDLTIHISVLNKPEPMYFTSEADLISQLRPGIDGLILTEGPHRGTFLPSVWENLPDPKTFLQHLKLKAGLPKHYWSDTLKIERYTVEKIPNAS